MRRALILLAVLAAPVRADDLKITGVRLTHGILGPTRTDKKIIPGDSICVCFNLEGLTVDKDGKVRYKTLLEVLDSAGKSIFRQESKPQEAINTLGGTQVPAHAQLDFGLSQAPGEFTFKLTVTDLATNKSQSLEHKGTIQPKGFGLVRLTTSADAEGRVPSGLLGVGQSLFVNGLVVGFERDPGTKQPKLTLELRVLDDAGKATLAAPLSGTIEKNVPPTALSVPIQFLVSLNRPGKFTIEVTATDKVSSKTDKHSFNINVAAQQP